MTTTSNSNEVLKDTLKGGMGYLHSCLRLKCIGESMFMRWCFRDVYGMVQCKNEVMQCRQVFFCDLSNNVLHRKQHRNDSLKIGSKEVTPTIPSRRQICMT
jgi:hypothetical protein